MKDLIEMLPQIIVPFILGGIFMYTFNSVSLHQSHDDHETNWFFYYLVGFIIQTAASAVRSYLASQYDIHCISVVFYGIICVVVILIAFVCAKLFRSSVFASVRAKLGIHDTFEKNYWTDLNDAERGTRVRVHLNDSDTYIEGRLQYLESNTRFPQIALANYSISQGDIDLEDRSQDNMLISVDTQKCDFIELKYDSKSRTLITKVI